MHETRVQPLGQEDPLEKEMATHSSILAWKIPWMDEPWAGGGATTHGVAKSWTQLKKQGKYSNDPQYSLHTSQYLL